MIQHPPPHIPENSNVNNTYELIEKSRQITKVLNKISNENEQNQTLKKVQEKTEDLELLVSKRSKLLSYIRDKKIPVIAGEKNDLIIRTNSVNDENKIVKNVSRLIEDVIDFKQEKKLLPNLSLSEEKVSKFEDINGNLLEESALVFKNGNKKFENLLEDEIEKNKDRENKLGEKVNELMASRVKEILGFRPTIKNIVSILAADAEDFVNLLKTTVRASEEHHRNNINIDNPRNITENFSFAFPEYFTTVTYNSLDNDGGGGESSPTKVQTYPGENPIYKDWPEVNFVEAFIKTKLAIHNETGDIKDGNFSPNKNIGKIYTSPKQSGDIYRANLNKGYKVLTEILKRYIVATKYSFNNENDNNFRNFLQKIESYNLIEKINNTTAFDEIKTLVGVDDTLQLTEEVLDNPNYTKFNNFFEDLDDLDEFNIDGENYKLKIVNGSINDEFDGISISEYSTNRNPFDDTTDRELNRLLSKINSETNFIKNNDTFLNFQSFPKKYIVESNDGYLFIQDIKFRENGRKSVESDYMIPNRLENELPQNLVDQINVTVNNFTSPLELFTGIVKVYYSDLIDTDKKLFLNLPAIWEIPVGVLFLINDSITGGLYSNLSERDKNTIKNFCEEFAEDNEQALLTVISDEFTNNNFSKDSKIWDILGERKFLNVHSTDSFAIDKDISDMNSSFEVNDNLFNNYVNGIIRVFLKRFEGKNKDANSGKNKEIDSGIDNSEIKLAAYNDFRELYQRWIGAGEDFFRDRSIIDFFRFVDRANRDIGDKAIVNFEGVARFINDNDNANFLQVLAKLFRDNKYLFFPVENFMRFDGTDESGENRWTLEDIFTPQLNVIGGSEPAFTAMYVGGYSSVLNIRNDKDETSSDSFSICATDDSPPDDLENGQVQAFILDWGRQKQNMFSSVSVSTTQYKKTREYYKALDEISKISQNPVQSARMGQNLLNVYNLYSFSLDVQMMGNVMIQPMMYLCLRGIPLFNGTYMITNVSHDLSPNKIGTSFEAVRLARIPKPIATDYVATVKRAYDITRVESFNTVNKSNETDFDSNGEFGDVPSDVTPPSSGINSLSFQNSIDSQKNRLNG